MTDGRTDGRTTCPVCHPPTFAPGKLVGASARGPAFSWVQYSRRLRRHYSCDINGAPYHCASAPRCDLLNQLPSASRPLAGCPRCDADRYRTDTQNDSASHFRSTQLIKAGNLWARPRGAQRLGPAFSWVHTVSTPPHPTPSPVFSAPGRLYPILS